MGYAWFKTKLVQDLKEYLPGRYENWVLQIRDIPKVNGYMEGIHLLPEDGTGETPTLYIEDLYRFYQECEDMDMVCRKAAAAFVQGMEYAACVSESVCKDMSGENVIYCLINAENNQRLLNEVPHRMVMDLALIYRMMIRAGEDGFNSAIITHELADELGFTEEELYHLAVENTPRILPEQIYYGEDCLAIVTNCCKLLGAAVLLYPGILGRVADTLGGDLLIIPSSIHEIFLIRSDGQDLANLNRTVVEANNTIVRPEEFLSHHVYYYNKARETVGIPVE